MLKIIPFGDRIMVKRRKVGTTLKDGKTAGGIVLPNAVEERLTDLADVIDVPDLTFSDNYILENSEKIVTALTDKAVTGDTDALVALLKFNEFIKLKSIKEGDAVVISKYVGTDIAATGEKDALTLVFNQDIIGLLVNNES